MKIICVVRKPFLIGGNLVNWNPVKRCWPILFDMPWGEFRDKLREIAWDNHQSCGFDEIVGADEVSPLLDDPNSVFVPTDDDDWFHPDLVSHLRLLGPGTYRWNDLEYTGHNVAVYGERPPSWRFHFQTNNYAFSGPGKLEWVPHLGADGELRGREFFIADCLSVHNKTAASGSSWFHHKTPIDVHRGLPREFNGCVLDPAFERWEIQMQELYLSVSNRYKFL